MGRHGEKKFTTWEYSDRDGARIEVPVTLVDNAKKDRRETDTYFRVHLAEPEVDEKDSDINRLRETVFSKIREGLKIEWQSMLVVEVTMSRSRLFEKKKKPSTPDTETNANGSLTLHWKRVQIATLGKQKMQRTFNNFHKPWHGEKEPAREVWDRACADWPEVGKAQRQKSYCRDDPKITAMIPDTPENRVALEAIGDNIEKLYRSLGALLGSDRIEQTLARVATNGLLALPAPSNHEAPKVDQTGVKS